MDERSGLGSYAHGAFAVDYERRIDFDGLREQRLERARAALADSDLDALLVWKDENVRYLSGLAPQIIQGKSALLNGCLLTADGKMPSSFRRRGGPGRDCDAVGGGSETRPDHGGAGADRRRGRGDDRPAC